MSPTASDLSFANFILGHTWLSFLYYAKVGWPYLVIAFLIGSIPFGLIVGRVFFKTDIRSSGSGNIGAANAARTFGRGAGIVVLVLDASKGIAAVVIAKWTTFALLTASSTTPFFATPELPHVPYQFGDTPIAVSLALGPLAALAAVLGHCYSPWLGFKGGKGVATFLGTLLALGFPLFRSPSIFAIAWILVCVRTGYASLSSIIATAAVAGYIVIFNVNQGDGDNAILFGVVSLAIVVVRHRENIARLTAGTESKLTLGSPQGPADSRGKRASSI